MPLSDQEIKSVIEKAKAYAKLGNYEEALEVYEKIIEQKPDYAEAWKNKGNVLKRLGRYEEARSAYEKAAEYYIIDSLPFNSALATSCYFNIIAEYIFSIEAKDEYSRDLKKFGRELSNGTISIELREFFKENKHHLSEKAKVEKIKEVDWLGFEGKWWIKDEGKVYILDQEYQEISIFLENTPPHPHYYMKHAVLISPICLDTAIGDMDRAIELDPDRGEYYRYRGEFLLKKVYEDDKKISTEKKSFFEKVIADYKTSLEKNPSDPKIWLKLMELNILLHNWDDAISISGSCRPFIQTNEDQLIRVWLGCTALALAGDTIEEKDKNLLYDQTIRTEFTSILSRITSPSFLDEIQEKEECKEKWEKAIEIYKLFIEHLDDWEGRGDILKRLGCYKEAVEAYNRAIGLKPECARRIYKKKGDILNKFLKHYEEAIQAYDRSIELEGKDYNIWYEKAMVLEVLERYAEALNAFNKVEELDSAFFSYFRLWIHQGSLLEKLSRYEEALKLYDKAIEQGNIREAWDSKYNLLKKIDRYEEANEVFDKARRIRSERAEEFYKLACESAREGAKSDVIWRLSNAIELDPKYKDLAKKNEAFKNFWEDEGFKKIVG